jgi:hypothetical protein
MCKFGPGRLRMLYSTVHFAGPDEKNLRVESAANIDPDAHQSESWIRIRSRIKVKSMIRFRIWIRIKVKRSFWSIGGSQIWGKREW